LTQLILLAFIILYLQVIPNFPVIQSCWVFMVSFLDFVPSLVVTLTGDSLSSVQISCDPPQFHWFPELCTEHAPHNGCSQKRSHLHLMYNVFVHLWQLSKTVLHVSIFSLDWYISAEILQSYLYS
jgi:hypothetical protein